MTRASFRVLGRSALVFWINLTATGLSPAGMSLRVVVGRQPRDSVTVLGSVALMLCDVGLELMPYRPRLNIRTFCLNCLYIYRVQNGIM